MVSLIKVMLANKDIIVCNHIDLEESINAKMQALVVEGRLNKDIMVAWRPQQLHKIARQESMVDLLRMASRSKSLVWLENQRSKEHQWLALSVEADQFQVIQPRISHRSEIVKISISIDYEKSRYVRLFTQKLLQISFTNQQFNF